MIDLLLGTSGLVALVLAGAGSLFGSFAGFSSVWRERCRLQQQRAVDVPELKALHRQHEAMLSLMGAMVAGVLGSALGVGMASMVWLLYLHHVPTMMDYMSIANVVMTAGMGGMTGGVSGAWWSAGRAGFLCDKRDA
jgi:hypothetical protein